MTSSFRNPENLSVVLSFCSSNQASVQTLLVLLASLYEGIPVQYHLYYTDPEATLTIQAGLDAFSQVRAVEVFIGTAWVQEKSGAESTSRSLRSHPSDEPYSSEPENGDIARDNHLLLHCIQTYDQFLWLDPSCVILKQAWLRDLYHAFIRRKHPFIGHLKTDRFGTQSFPTHLSSYALYDGAALRSLHLQTCFELTYTNPWKALYPSSQSQIAGSTSQSSPLSKDTWTIDDTPLGYLLVARYFEKLTLSSDPQDWPLSRLDSHEELIHSGIPDAAIATEADPAFTVEAFVARHYKSQPIIQGIRNNAVRQHLAHRVRSRDAAYYPLYPVGGSFSLPPLDLTESIDASPPLLTAQDGIRADLSTPLTLPDLKNRFEGKRCFIVGNGPSLNQTDLTRLRHEFTIGLNRIYLNYPNMGFEPTFYCCVNPNVIDQFAHEIDQLNSIKFVTDRAKTKLKGRHNTFFMKSVPRFGFNEDLSNSEWHEGWTVTYCAMQVAFFLGFTEVVLVGVDHNFKDAGTPDATVTATGSDVNHFHPNYFGSGVVWQYPNLEQSEMAYQTAKEMYERHNRRIVDATIGGQLQVFPKVKYEAIALPPPSPSPTAMPTDDLQLQHLEQALIKRHPFYNNPLFLPTSKIPLQQRVEGLSRTLDIYDHHFHSRYLPRLRALRDRMRGNRRAFIIGNGPSLNDTNLDLLKNEVTFGVNGIFLKSEESGFKPTFYVVEDHLVAEDRQEAINQFDGVIKLFPIYLAYCLKEADDTVFFNHRSRRRYPHGFDFSTDASICTYTGCTVTFNCIQLAYYLGFREIYLIGVDCSYDIPEDVEETQEYSVATLDMKSDDVNHFDPNYFGKGYRWHDPQVNKMMEAYEEAHRVCQANGVTVYNATIGGKLEAFPRVDYDSLFSETPSPDSQSDLPSDSQPPDLQLDSQPPDSQSQKSTSIDSLVRSRSPYPRILLIDMTRMGEKSATGQVKQVWFGEWPQPALLQVFVAAPNVFGIQTKVGAAILGTGERRLTRADEVLEVCDRFQPDVIYYRPVAEQPFLHDFACRVIQRLNVPVVAHIVDDWPERLRQQNPERYAELDVSLRWLFHRATTCLSICDAMSEAFAERYGREFVAIANCVEPADWLAADAAVRSASHENTARNAAEDGDRPFTIRPFTIRYVGSLAEDMTLDSIKDVAQAMADLQGERSVQLEIYTRQLWKEKVDDIFAHIPGVKVFLSGVSQADYRALLVGADALLIGYNFDLRSISYVRYSMANKLPECLASATPVLAYGPPEVATIAYAQAIGCTQVVTQRDATALKSAICELIDHPERCQSIGQAAREYVFRVHSVQQVRTQFHDLLRAAAATPPAQSIPSVPELQQLLMESPTLPPRPVRATDVAPSDGTTDPVLLGEFRRKIHAHFDETYLIAEYTAAMPIHSVMVDVGAHYGGALKRFAQRGWQVYAFEPDPDNRENLLKTLGKLPDASRVKVDDRAVSDRPGQILPFYSSDESTGISALSPFRDTHQQRCEVTTTTVADICDQHQLDHIDFLKIDTEGYDLMVLKGVPWDRISPHIIECEFEDRKTVPLGYTFDDLAKYLTSRGYTVVVSEWHPVIRYGIKHDWRRLVTYPCELSSPDAWGNILAFKDTPDLPHLAAIAQQLLKTAPDPDPAQPKASGAAQTQSAQKTPASKSVKSNAVPQPQSQPPEPAAAPISNSPDPIPASKLARLKRFLRYYKRWPLLVALLAVGLQSAAMLDVPFRWALNAAGSGLILFLIGHVFSKTETSIETAERSQESAAIARDAVAGIDQRVGNSLKRSTRAIEKSKVALGEARRAAESAESAMKIVERSAKNSESALDMVYGVGRTAREALETASQIQGTAEMALEIANKASAKAKEAIAAIQATAIAPKEPPSADSSTPPD
ncbi:MAG: FkbM family methyltransferase [Elainellaceae cyanobacterium]